MTDTNKQTKALAGSESLMVRLYNQGYHAGHHDTVEGGYVDIFTCDMDTYHADVVAEILQENAELWHPESKP